MRKGKNPESRRWAMNVWKVFLAGIVAGVVLLLLLGAGYQ